MNIRKLLIITSCALSLATTNASAQETITVQDIKRFGWEYLGEKVTIYVYLHDVYACRQPSNKGKICTYMRHDNEWYQDALFAEGFRSKRVKPFLKNCVEMSGEIVEIDKQTQGAMTKVPSLIIDYIELADKSLCSSLE